MTRFRAWCRGGPRPVRTAGPDPHARLRPLRRIGTEWAAMLLVLAILGAGVPTVNGRGEAPIRDSALITPTTQGIVDLPQTGVALEIGYASVAVPTQITVTQTSPTRYSLDARDAAGSPVHRFEMPLVVHFPPGPGPYPVAAHPAGQGALASAAAESAGQPVSVVIGWPGEIVLGPPLSPDADVPDRGRWLVVFDANGVYALPAWEPLPESAVYLGPLEHYTPDLLAHDLAGYGLTYAASEPVLRAVLRTETRGGQVTTTSLPTGARSTHYRDRFLPDDLGNPGGWLLLGWTDGPGLIDMVRALRATLPDDPDLPAPGTASAPLDLVLPFDCAADWEITWGYHHSTPQNRFAVDFAPRTGEGPYPVYAAHAGTLLLKRYGSANAPIDIGLSAVVVAADGITRTVYGHLDELETRALWHLDADLPAFEPVVLGPVAAGDRIGVMGRTGYATGAHVHFALLSWDQSLYQPVPLGPLTEFPRGLAIPADSRTGCDLYAG